MPQTTDENRRIVTMILGEPANDGAAWQYLRELGYTEDRFVIHPPPKPHRMQQIEWELIEYLICEWDWGYEGYV